MLGVFGILFPELLYSVGLQTAPGLTSTFDWTQVGALDYGIPNNTLIAIEFFLFAWVEGRRLQVSERGDAGGAGGRGGRAPCVCRTHQ
jgi:hypothetical protein